MSHLMDLHALHELVLPDGQNHGQLTSTELRDQINLAKGKESQYPDAERVSPWLYKSSTNFS